MWPELHRPEGVGQAWDEHHPRLRAGVTWDGVMPVGGLNRQVAALALAVAGEHGFALGGGSALLARGVISRPTQDADLFTGQEHGVQAAAGFVEAALRCGSPRGGNGSPAGPGTPEPPAGNCRPVAPASSHSPGPGTARAVAGVSRVRMTLTRPGRNSGPDRTATLKPTGTTRRPSHDLTGPQDSLPSSSRADQRTVTGRPAHRN